MIITKTPFRISFAGGGTDLKEFYSRTDGAVVSTAINKYVYVAAHRAFDNNYSLKYSRTEHVDSVEKIQHPIIKQCLRKTRFEDFVEITSIADIPSSGSGLGSSSAFTVGLLKTLYAFKSVNKSNLTLGREACEVEIDELGEPIGRQDQYACAAGGLNLITFKQDGLVTVDPLRLPREVRAALEGNLVMFYTGITRSASAILAEQKVATSRQDKFDNLCRMRDLAYELCASLQAGDLAGFGRTLDLGWRLKQQMAAGISSGVIDEHYARALRLGATGGKLLGAGGGGFLLLYCEKEKQAGLRAGMGLKEMRFGFEPQGSAIIYMEEDNGE